MPPPPPDDPRVVSIEAKQAAKEIETAAEGEDEDDDGAADGGSSGAGECNADSKKGGRTFRYEFCTKRSNPYAAAAARDNKTEKLSATASAGSSSGMPELQ